MMYNLGGGGGEKKGIYDDTEGSWLCQAICLWPSGGQMCWVSLTTSLLIDSWKREWRPPLLIEDCLSCVCCSWCTQPVFFQLSLLSGAFVTGRQALRCLPAPGPPQVLCVEAGMEMKERWSWQADLFLDLVSNNLTATDTGITKALEFASL